MVSARRKKKSSSTKSYRSHKSGCSTSAYCLSCKQTHKIKSGHIRIIYNPRNRQKVKMCCGLCEQCGTKVCRIVKKYQE